MYNDIINKMKVTYQIKNKQTILQHGASVYRFYKDICSKKEKNWKLPDWFVENEKFIMENIHSHDLIKEYTILHDCGKPFCLEEDEFG